MNAPQGLTYIADAISDTTHNELITFFMNQSRRWTKAGGRLVQQFGYYYDYNVRAVNKQIPIEPIPEILVKLNKELINHQLITKVHNQIIVNLYEPGQGITAHCDHVKYFGEEIATISLGSAVIMNFRHTGQVYPQVLKPASIAVLTGDARWIWTHEIPARKSDIINGKKIFRDNRISITYRTVV